MKLSEELETNSKKIKLYYFDMSLVDNNLINRFLDFPVKKLEYLSTNKTTAYKLPINKDNYDHSIFVRKVENCTKCCRYPDCNLLPINNKKDKK